METLILLMNTNPSLKFETIKENSEFLQEFKKKSRFTVISSAFSDEEIESIRKYIESSGKSFSIFEWLANEKSEEPLKKLLSDKSRSDCVFIKVAQEKNIDKFKKAISKAESSLRFDNVVIYSSYPLLRNVNEDIVPDAYVIDELSFDEAESLLYYGAEMIDVSGIYNFVNNGVNIQLKSFVEKGCTIITNKPSRKAERKIVKGFSTIYGVSILTLEGVGFKGVSGITTRLASACSSISVSFMMIAQGASESAISVVVKDEDSSRALLALNKEFADEIYNRTAEPIKIDNHNAIITAVGDKITDSPVFLSSFYSAFASWNVNVKLSTLTKGDNTLCAVIKSNDVKKALSGLNAEFCLSKVTISVGLFGAGNVGKELISQIAGQEEELNRRGIDIRLRAIATSKKMLLSESGVDLANWKSDFDDNCESIDVDKMVDFIDSDAYPYTLIIDCTADSKLPLKYYEWFERGIHIITPNKKAGVSDFKYYSSLLDICKKNNVFWLHEATVGAGLPVISTVNDLIKTGDKIKKVSGIVSGTLAYLFSNYDGKVPFSKLVLKAKELGYTESDPREDLSGMDVARKVVILAREIGQSIELGSLNIISLVPEELKNVPYDEFVKNISKLDAPIEKMYKKAVSEGKVLRYTGEVNADGRCSVQLSSYPQEHVFAQTKGTDNVIVFETERYFKECLVVKGPGAGIEVTAGGVFADLLRLCTALGASI